MAKTHVDIKIFDINDFSRCFMCTVIGILKQMKKVWRPTKRSSAALLLRNTFTPTLLFNGFEHHLQNREASALMERIGIQIRFFG